MAHQVSITVQRAELVIRAGVALGPDLTAIEALTGTGFPERTADNTWALRPAWQYSFLAANISESAGVVSPSGMSFVPIENKRYRVEAYLLFNAAASTTGLQWRFTAPSSGLTTSAQALMVPNTINAQVLRFAQLGVVVAGTSSPSADALAKGDAILICGAGPIVGSLLLEFATEVPGSAVTLLPGSHMRWIEIPTP